MSMHFRKLGLAAGLAALLGVVSGVNLGAVEIIEQILVKVNGEIFTKGDLEQRQIAALRQKNQFVTEKELQNDAALKAALDEVTPQILVSAVDELLLMQRAKEMNLHLTDDRFAEVLTRIRKDNKLEDDAAWEQALKQEGLSLAELRRNIEKDLLIGEVQRQDVMQKIAVTEEESKAYYEGHKSEFTSASMVTLREIVVSVPDKAPEGTANAGQSGVNVGLDEEAKAKAEAIRQRALKGEDFAKIAAAESDSPSKANGGLIGPINHAELSPAMQKLVDGMKPGAVAEPIRIAKGYQLIKLEASTASVVQTYDQARDQVSNRVFMSKRGAELEKYVRRLRAEAMIEWKNDELKKVYEKAVAADAVEPTSAPTSDPTKKSDEPTVPQRKS
jgi:parvulin-like peptidyl-prolyl isomerase